MQYSTHGPHPHIPLSFQRRGMFFHISSLGACIFFHYFLFIFVLWWLIGGGGSFHLHYCKFIESLSIDFTWLCIFHFASVDVFQCFIFIVSYNSFHKLCSMMCLVISGWHLLWFRFFVTEKSASTKIVVPLYVESFFLSQRVWTF